MIGKKAMDNPNTFQPSIAFQPLARPAKQHRLYEIDLERNTAFCTACGYIEIHVVKGRTRQSKVYCGIRFQEMREQYKKPFREEKRGNQVKKPRHTLSQIDPEKGTAICAICGPTDIRKQSKKGSILYVCGKVNREYQSPYHRNYYVRKTDNPLIHSLSEINEEKKTAVCSICGPVEIYVWQGRRKIGCRCSNASITYSPRPSKLRREINTTLIYQYKADYGCERCGQNKNLLNMYLYSRDSVQKEIKIESLLRLARQELMQELENCEVICGNCRDPQTSTS
jgi:hypothetical protein